jgi:GNAT superfamily N-acetyltransferase
MCVFLPMAEVPKRWRSKLHKLSLGSVEGAMVRWSYHDGSTWTTILFEGDRRDPNAIIGWAVFTLQEARHPIIGVFVSKKHRRMGYGSKLVVRLLEECKDRVPHGKIYAVADWWPRYTTLIARFGFKQLEWD